VARSQGNYISIDNLASDVRKKLGGETIGVIFPILSRNRFAMILKGLSRGCKKIFLMLSYPHDEVGNSFLSYDELDEKGINPYSDVLDLKTFKDLFGIRKHEFTGVDYVDYYEKIITGENCQVEIIFANQAKAILKYTDVVLACDIHTRFRTKKILKKNGAKIVLGLDDLCTESINGSGFNEKYGLLGSNKATEEKLKLFPKLKESQELVEKIQAQFLEKTGKKVEVMIYGDGAFKDPQGKIWELADPVVSPAFTETIAINSSPPVRYTFPRFPTVSARQSAAPFISSSPAACPFVSLTIFNPFTSTEKITKSSGSFFFRNTIKSSS
jgi:hypothetical protein